MNNDSKFADRLKVELAKIISRELGVSVDDVLANLKFCVVLQNPKDRRHVITYGGSDYYGMLQIATIAVSLLCEEYRRRGSPMSEEDVLDEVLDKLFNSVRGSSSNETL